MFRTIVLASRLLILSTGAAMAQQALPAHPGDAAGGGAWTQGAALGGGEVRMQGSGADASFLRIAPGPVQAGRSAAIAGGLGAGPEVTYLAPVPPGERGRIALLMGSGENASIVYLDRATGAPRGRG